MSSLRKKINRAGRMGLALILVALGLVVLAACGDATATPAPASKASPTAMSNEELAKQSGAGSPAATGATTAAGSSTTAAVSATTSAAGGTTAATTPGAAATPASTIAPTPTGTTQVEAPSLAYPGGREIKLSDATRQQLNQSLTSGTENEFLGKFNPGNISILLTTDDLDKIEAFYKKTLEGAGWQQYSRNSNGSVVLQVYQKNGTKFVAQYLNLTPDQTQGFPDDIKAAYKQGDKMIIFSTGTAFLPPPTPFAIPGSPTMAVGAGQKKIATIEMEKGGTIVIELYPDIAPKTVENFEKLANKGFYNGLTFHRVEPNFVVQGGDPQGTGQGGPGYNIPDEFTTQKKHQIGTIAMAHSSAPNSAGSQFYIVTGEASHLDGQYAIFGQVTQGMDVVNKIAVGDKMKSVKVEVK